MLARIKLSGTRIFVNGTNLLTFDKVNNWDPESGSEVGSAYPQLRAWNFGINVTF